MASYPGTPSAYPGTPKAYPGTPKAYPGAVNSFPADDSFTPATIAGLVAWFDMLDAAAFTESAGVMTSIINKASATVWDGTEFVTLPAYAATGLNGHPCMDLDGTTMGIVNSEAAVWQAVQNAHAYTLFVVAAIDTVDRLEAMFAVGAVGVSSNRTRVWGQSNASLGLYRSFTQNDAATAVTVLGATQTDTNAHKLCWHSPGTTVSGEIDGAPDVTDGAQDPGTLTPTRTGIGLRPDIAPDGFFDGKIGEILLYDSELTDPQIAEVITYLARWD